MKKWAFLLAISTVMLLSSCIEIVDDLKLNLDGSGELNYNVNLSGSKVKINSIFALDSLNGKKVPSREEVRQKIMSFKTTFESQPGIEEVTLDMDFDNYMLKLKVNFENVVALQDAIKATVEKSAGNTKEWFDDDTKWLTWSENKMIRSIPEIRDKKLANLKSEEIELLKKGSYISITRFEKPVLKCDNENAIISKNKLAVMVRTDAFALSQNLNLLENTIYLNIPKL